MISQTIHFEVSPEALYDMFMDEKKHSAFTGATAIIDARVGGKFSVWDGYATGENLELVPGKKIVQTWRASDWPDRSLSKVTFVFTPSSLGTDLTFTHEDVPSDCQKDIAEGWDDFYWKPLAVYIQGK